MRRIHLSAPAESQLPDSQIFCKILMYCTAGCLPQILYSQSKNRWHADKLCLVFKPLDCADKHICSSLLFSELRPKSAMSCCI